MNTTIYVALHNNYICLYRMCQKFLSLFYPINISIHFQGDCSNGINYSNRSCNRCTWLPYLEEF